MLIALPTQRIFQHLSVQRDDISSAQARRMRATLIVQRSFVKDNLAGWLLIEQ